MSKPLLPALFLTAVLMLQACSPVSISNRTEVIATVGDKSLTYAEALEMIPDVSLQEDTLTAVVEFAAQWRDRQVLLREAERAGLENHPDVQARLSRLRDQVLREALKESVLLNETENLEISREEAQNYFQAHRDRFVLEEPYMKFRHLTAMTRTEADNARRDLGRGVPWEEVARQYSTDPERQIRESEQFWPISMALADIPVLNGYLQIIGISERSQIEFFRGEFHFVQLIEERPEGEHPDLEWLIPQLQEWLKLEKARRITEGYLRNLYLQAESDNEIHLADVSEIESIVNQNRNQ